MAARPEGPCGDRVHHRSRTIRVVGRDFKFSAKSDCPQVLTLFQRLPCQIPLLRMSRSTTIKLPALNISPPPRGFRTVKTRGRSGSIVKVEQVGDRSTEEALDRSAYVNINADWVNAKGLHGPMLEFLLEFLSLRFSRCMANPRRTYHLRKDHYRHRARDDTANKLDIGQSLLSGGRFFFVQGVYAFSHRTPTQLSYLMFHWVTGIPFENDLHGGAYDDLTLWEQIDDGAQYTPAKKWLFTVPVTL